MKQIVHLHCYTAMKDFKFILLTSLVFLLFTVLMPVLEFNLNLIAIFFITGNFLFVFTTFSILKYGKPSGKKFDEGEWYEDLKERE